MNKYAEVPNPYDFANPVFDPQLFAGRENELNEINYYLDHAQKASRAINLALIGGRASGKTSLLNMIEFEGKEREFCVVRIELDEADIETQLSFFYKLFDAIITTACIEDAYGGVFGKTYVTYRDIVDAYEIPDDKLFCPFIFPMQYSKAMERGNLQVPLSDTAFKRDLVNIKETLKKPIVILIDECDVLSLSRVHLEKLRNIFMNISGYMLVLTGTERFFPLINDVFSPIIRQFKKINVVPFNEVDETKTCVLKPLESVGIKANEIIDFETIHDLSGGRPYEIQLICHLLFRRVQQERSKSMELTIDVLDDVLNELQSLQDTTERKIINGIRSLNKKQLSAIKTLCASTGRATFDQVWFTEYLINSSTNWTKDELDEQLNYLVGNGIIHIENERITFAGDEFDKIYCKYYSRIHGVHLNIREIPHEILSSIWIGNHIQKKLKCLDVRPYIETGLIDSSLQDIYSLFELSN